MDGVLTKICKGSNWHPTLRNHESSMVLGQIVPQKIRWLRSYVSPKDDKPTAVPRLPQGIPQPPPSQPGGRLQCGTRWLGLICLWPLRTSDFVGALPQLQHHVLGTSWDAKGFLGNWSWENLDRKAVNICKYIDVNLAHLSILSII